MMKADRLENQESPGEKDLLTDLRYEIMEEQNPFEITFQETKEKKDGIPVLTAVVKIRGAYQTEKSVLEALKTSVKAHAAEKSYYDVLKNEFQRLGWSFSLKESQSGNIITGKEGEKLYEGTDGKWRNPMKQSSTYVFEVTPEIIDRHPKLELTTNKQVSIHNTAYQLYTCKIPPIMHDGLEYGRDIGPGQLAKLISYQRNLDPRKVIVGELADGKFVQMDDATNMTIVQTGEKFTIAIAHDTQE